MHKTKSKILLGFALALSLAMLVGCGNGQSSGTSSDTTTGGGTTPKVDQTAFVVPEGGYDGSAVTIKFYHTMSTTNLTPVLDQYITSFNEIYPNITVEYTSVGSYDDVRNQIKTEIAIGNQPNLAYCYPDHVALYNKAKAVISLDNLINSQVSDGKDGIIGLTQAQKDDFIEAYYNEGKQFADGRMYTLPFSKSTEVLYYNKTFFTANNLSVPDHWFSTGDDDKTSLEYVCQAIKTIDPNSTPLGYDSSANWFITMCEQLEIPYTSATGDHFLFNNADAKAFVNKFKDWSKKGYVTTQKLLGTYTSSIFKETDPSKQKSYMSIGSSAGATHQRPDKVGGNYPFDVGIAEIPQANANHKRVISQGPSVCIFRNSDPQKVMASWLFLKYLTTSVEFQAEFSLASGYVPVLKSVKQNETFAEKLEARNGGDNISSLSAYVCMEQVANYFTSPAFVGSSEARDQVGGIIDAMLADITDKKNIDTVFADAITECEYQVTG